MIEITDKIDNNKFEVINVNDSEKPQKLISVIIPTYQEEKIISGLSSVYTNELKFKYNFEVILSDGGSSDRTVELAKIFADKITVHNSSRRQTISEGRNKGAEQAVGKILVFINADTYPENINQFFQYITDWSNSHVQKYHAIACEVNGFPDEVNNGDKFFYAFHNRYVHFLNKIHMGMGRGECQIVYKNYFQQVNGYNPSIVAGEDFDLFRRLSKITKIKYEPKLVVLESPRRFRKYGYLKTLWFWTLNSLSIMLSGRSYSKEWEAIR